MSRDRGGTFAEGAKQGAPEARPVAAAHSPDGLPLPLAPEPGRRSYTRAPAPRRRAPTGAGPGTAARIPTGRPGACRRPRHRRAPGAAPPAGLARAHPAGDAGAVRGGAAGGRVGHDNVGHCPCAAAAPAHGAAVPAAPRATGAPPRLAVPQPARALRRLPAGALAPRRPHRHDAVAGAGAAWLSWSVSNGGATRRPLAGPGADRGAGAPGRRCTGAPVPPPPAGLTPRQATALLRLRPHRPP